MTGIEYTTVNIINTVPDLTVPRRLSNTKMHVIKGKVKDVMEKKKDS